MKAIKGALLFGICVLAVSACFDPPQFGLVPLIDYESIYYREAKAVGERDSLVLGISFKDGNGDLGLSATQIEPPFHDLNYYLASNGNIIPVEKETVYSNLSQFVKIPPGVTGKLVTNRTAEDPAYADDLPLFTDPYSCTFYAYTSVYVNEADKAIFDDSYNLDSVLSVPNFPKVYVLLDTFYYQRNPNHVNIEVEFWVKESNGYTLFDWEKEFCTISFNQRFPVLTEKTGPLEGSLQYAMVTTGLKSIFSIKTLKLRIRIRDRSLNVSETIETPEFTLDKIKK
jgi:hypothetical protein